MKLWKSLLLTALHLAITLGSQAIILRLLLGDGAIGGGRGLTAFGMTLLLCAADLIGSCFLLRGHGMRRLRFLALHFWDLILISPLLLLVILSLFSGQEGRSFALTALAGDLLLIVNRSSSFVFFDPTRRELRKKEQSTLAPKKRKV
jgi:hypothetical protein